MALKEIALKDLRIDGGTQQRFEIDEPTVQQYANRMRMGDKFPEMTVLYDGSTFWLVDGFHRYHAYSRLKKNIVEVDVEQGTRREAIWMSLNVNQTHGLRRKYEDVKRMLFKTIFPDHDWAKETDAAIGYWIGCSDSYVCKRRKEYEKSLEAPAVTPEPEVEAPTDEPVPEPSPPEAVIDEVGKEVPKHLEPVFNRRPEIKELIKTVGDIHKKVKDAQLKGDMLYVNCKVDQLKADLGNFRRNLRFTLPYAVCPMCGGDVNNQECTACDQHGFVNESVYNAIPDEMKV